MKNIKKINALVAIAFCNLIACSNESPQTIELQESTSEAASLNEANLVKTKEFGDFLKGLGDGRLHAVCSGDVNFEDLGGSGSASLKVFVYAGSEQQEPIIKMIDLDFLAPGGLNDNSIPPLKLKDGYSGLQGILPDNESWQYFFSSRELTREEKERVAYSDEAHIRQIHYIASVDAAKSGDNIKNPHLIKLAIKINNNGNPSPEPNTRSAFTIMQWKGLLDCREPGPGEVP